MNFCVGQSGGVQYKATCMCLSYDLQQVLVLIYVKHIELPQKWLGQTKRVESLESCN